ncbi:dihydrolipoamide acetyltransferase family protein [Thauera sp.]|uniref:dihydrolipoamide acetyltransferase family protein n=1 Tax=Thauera sp. TaxID=1905334 RepID=UPI00257C546A|nr:dihydrolipoamide acetyltransferase family protein [Thauera sp.]
MFEFKLPSLGADMDEGKLLEWHVKPGDKVKKGQVVAVVDTSKAAVDVEIWQDGTVFELLVEPGTRLPVGSVMATLLEEGESAPARKPVTLKGARKGEARRKAPPPEVAAEAVGVQRAAELAPPGRPRVSPAAAARQAEMRRTIAAAMSRSKREIPHYYLFETIPLARASEWLAAVNADRPITERILMAALLLKAVAITLKGFPALNGFYRNERFEHADAVHAGIAISLRGGGLVAPALHDVDSKTLPVLMRELSDLVRRTRAGSLRSSEMSGPTITVTNLGEQGVEAVMGVIYPPQVALVGFGRVASRPVVDEVSGELRVLPAVTASLAADHRVSDGHRGALFLGALRELLQHPEDL